MLHVRIDIPPIPAMLEALVEGLVLLDIEMLKHAEARGVELPPIYESGIVYRREPIGREWWESARDLLHVAKDRSGDCEDVCAFRCAELRYYDNEDASPRVIVNPTGSFHVVVERADGSIEDVSRILLDIESERTGIPITVLARKTTTDTRYQP